MNFLENETAGKLFIVTDEQIKDFAQSLIEKAKCAFRDEAEQAAMNNLLTPDDVVEMYHISKPTLWRWAKAGYLVPIPIGGKRRYRKADVDNIISKKGAVEE
jgi:predicted DNA-binding transcriptional regulator AlpA